MPGSSGTSRQHVGAGVPNQKNNQRSITLSLPPFVSKICSWVSSSIASSLGKTKRGHDEELGDEMGSDDGGNSRARKRQRQETGDDRPGQPGAGVDDDKEVEDKKGGARPEPRWKLGNEEVGKLKTFQDPDRDGDFASVRLSLMELQQCSLKMLEEAQANGGVSCVDFVLDCGKRVRGHKAWLMERCGYLRAMLESEMIEGRTGIVRVRDTSERAFSVFLEFLYTDELNSDKCHGLDWEELYTLADLFGCTGLQLNLASAVTWGNVESAATIAVEKGIAGGLPIKRMLLACAASFPHAASGAEEAETIIRVATLLKSQYPQVLDKPEILHDLIQPVSSAMKLLIEREDMQAQGLIILSFGAEEYDKYFLDYDDNYFPIMDAILDALQQHVGNARIQEYGCDALDKILEDGIREKIEYAYNHHAIEAALDAMREHPDDGEVQEKASYVLARLAADSDTRKSTLIEPYLGAMDLLWNAVKVHTHDAGVLPAVFDAIWQIAEDTPEWPVRENAIAKGVTSTIAQAMRAHADCSFVQENGAAALYQLLLPYKDADIVGESFVIFHAKRREAVDVVVDAMERHPTESWVQTRCIELCHDFLPRSTSEQCLDDDAETLTNNTRSRFAVALVAGMKANADDYVLQETCCGTLNWMRNSLGPRLLDLAVKHGAIGALVAAVNNHPSEGDVVKNTVLSLLGLGPDYHQLAVEAGAIQALSTAVQVNFYDSETDIQFIHLLEKVLKVNHPAGEPRPFLGQCIGEGVIDVILKCMEHGPGIVERCCQLLGLMVGLSDEQHTSLLDSGAIECVLNVMWRYPAGQEKNWDCDKIAACAAIRKLARGAVGTQQHQGFVSRVVIQGGGIAPLLSMLEKFSSKAPRVNWTRDAPFRRGDRSQGVPYRLCGPGDDEYAVALRDVLETLTIIFNSSQYARRTARDEDGIVSIIRVMNRKKNEDDGTIRLCLTILDRLLDTDQEDEDDAPFHPLHHVDPLEYISDDEGAIYLLLYLLQSCQIQGRPEVIVPCCRGDPGTHNTCCEILSRIIDHSTESKRIVKNCLRDVYRELLQDPGFSEEEVDSNRRQSCIHDGGDEDWYLHVACEELEAKLRKCLSVD